MYGCTACTFPAICHKSLQAFASTHAATTTEAASKTDNSALQSQFHLSHVVKIYVPSTMNGSTPVTDEVHAKYVDQQLTFSNFFGGATTISGTGGWVDDNKKLIKEKVTIVYSFAEKLDNQALDEVVAYAIEEGYDAISYFSRGGWKNILY